jgi:hypothetical protein
MSRDDIVTMTMAEVTCLTGAVVRSIGVADIEHVWLDLWVEREGTAVPVCDVFASNL